MDRVNKLPYCIVSMDKAIYLIKTPTGVRTIEIKYAVIKILSCQYCGHYRQNYGEDPIV